MIKISVILGIILTACLWVLSKQGYFREMVPPGEPAIPTSEHVVIAPTREAASIRPEKRESIESSQSPDLPETRPQSTANAVPSEIPDNWQGLLFPELVRIAELEMQPASAAIAELLPMLDNSDPAVRLAVVESLGDMTIDGSLPALSMALSDPDPQIRIAALEALAARDEVSVIGSIESRLYDPQREVRLAAIEALGDLEHELAVHSLAGLLSDADPLIRSETVSALGEIGGEYALTYLLQARYDPARGIRARAEAILAEPYVGIAD